MLRSGPIALFVHGLWEFAAAIICLLVPFVADVSHTARNVSWGAAAAFVVLALVADTRMPQVAHLVADVLVAAALIATSATFLAVIGGAHLLISLATRYEHDPTNPVGPLAASTSTDIEAGEHTVLDD
jgi:cation transporter-like permease